jgi:hypothetical protein
MPTARRCTLRRSNSSSWKMIKMQHQVCGPNGKGTCTFIENGTAQVYNLGNKIPLRAAAFGSILGLARAATTAVTR